MRSDGKCQKHIGDPKNHRIRLCGGTRIDYGVMVAYSVDIGNRIFLINISNHSTSWNETPRYLNKRKRPWYSPAKKPKTLFRRQCILLLSSLKCFFKRNFWTVISKKKWIFSFLYKENWNLGQMSCQRTTHLFIQ